MIDETPFRLQGKIFDGLRNEYATNFLAYCLTSLNEPSHSRQTVGCGPAKIRCCRKAKDASSRSTNWKILSHFTREHLGAFPGGETGVGERPRRMRVSLATHQDRGETKEAEGKQRRTSSLP